MAITEESRHHLFRRLEEILGHEEAVTMMEHLPPVGWADVATKHDLDQLHSLVSRDIEISEHRLRTEMGGLRTEMADLRTDMAGLRTDMAGLRTELRTDMAGLEVGLRTEMGGLEVGLRTEMAGLRTELRTDMAGLEVRLVTAFGGFRDQIHAEQRTTNRQIVVALVVALISVVLSARGVR